MKKLRVVILVQFFEISLSIYLNETAVVPATKNVT